MPRFRDVWTIPKEDGDAVGKSWENAIAGIPEGDRSPGMLRAIAGLPWVEAIAVTALVFLPRFAFTIQYLRKPRPDNGEAARAAGNGSAQFASPPATRPPAGEGSGFPSAYGDERGDSYAELDGTANQS